MRAATFCYDGVNVRFQVSAVHDRSAGAVCAGLHTTGANIAGHNADADDNPDSNRVAHCVTLPDIANSQAAIYAVATQPINGIASADDCASGRPLANAANANRRAGRCTRRPHSQAVPSAVRRRFRDRRLGH
jgi:hypothetical protein